MTGTNAASEGLGRGGELIRLHVKEVDESLTSFHVVRRGPRGRVFSVRKMVDKDSPSAKKPHERWLAQQCRLEDQQVG